MDNAQLALILPVASALALGLIAVIKYGFGQIAKAHEASTTAIKTTNQTLIDNTASNVRLSLSNDALVRSNDDMRVQFVETRIGLDRIAMILNGQVQPDDLTPQVRRGNGVPTPTSMKTTSKHRQPDRDTDDEGDSR